MAVGMAEEKHIENIKTTSHQFFFLLSEWDVWPLAE